MHLIQNHWFYNYIGYFNTRNSAGIISSGFYHIFDTPYHKWSKYTVVFVCKCIYALTSEQH